MTEVLSPQHQAAKGGRENKVDESDVHLPQPPKKSSYLLRFVFIFIFIFSIDFFYRVFGRFVTRGVQKHEKTFHKIPSGLITKNVAFFSPSVVLLDFFNRVFGRFVTRGVQKRDKKKTTESVPQPPKTSKKMLACSRLFFLRPPLEAAVLYETHNWHSPRDRPHETHPAFQRSLPVAVFPANFISLQRLTARLAPL
jgi:hypothetical protein